MTSVFQRLMQLTVDLFGQNLRLADLQFITFAAHHLDEDGELQFAAAHDFKRIGATGFFDANGDVGQQLFIETVAQIARSDILAFPARKRRVVDGEGHRDRRLIDLNLRQRHGGFGAGDRFPDGDAFDAGDGENVARLADGFIDALQAFERIQLGDVGFVDDCRPASRWRLRRHAAECR